MPQGQRSGPWRLSQAGKPSHRDHMSLVPPTLTRGRKHWRLAPEWTAYGVRLGVRLSQAGNHLAQAVRPSYRWYDAAAAETTPTKLKRSKRLPEEEEKAVRSRRSAPWARAGQRRPTGSYPVRLCGFESRRALHIGQRWTPAPSDTHAPAGDGGAHRMAIVQR